MIKSTYRDIKMSEPPVAMLLAGINIFLEIMCAISLQHKDLTHVVNTRWHSSGWNDFTRVARARAMCARTRSGNPELRAMFERK